MTALSLIQMCLLGLTLALLPVGLVRSRAALAEWLREIPRPVLAALTLVTASGTIVRLYGSLWNVDYENAHAYHTFAAFGSHAAPSNPVYSLAVPTLWHALFAVTGPSLDATFALHFVLASLTPPLLFFAARGIYRDDGAALVAATLLAFNPTHVRTSATDNFFVPELFFWALGLGALAFALSHPRGRPALFSAAAALCFGAQCRPFGAVAAIVALALFLFQEGGPRPWLREPAFRASLALAALVLPLHAFFLVRYTLPEGMRINATDGVPHLARVLKPESNVLLDLATTPWVLLALALAGLAALSDRSRRRTLALIVLPLLVNLWFNGPGAQNQTGRLRYHLEPLFWTALLAGGSALLLHRWPRLAGRRRSLAVGALMLLAASGLYLNRRVLARRFDSQQEYAFLRRAAPSLPTEATIVTLDDRLPGTAVNTALPRPWFERLGKHWDYAPATTWRSRVPPTAPAGRPVIWYRGITCWMFDWPEPKPPAAPGPPGTPDPRMRRECQDLERAFVLEPIDEARFAAHPERMIVVAPRLTIGFYRLLPRAAAPSM